jgi:outer membrane lipoprotein-sorting protein
MRRVAALLFCCLLVVGAAVIALAQNPSEFSADLQMKSPEMGETVKGKIYFAGKKTRMDMNAQGHQSRIITDSQAQKSYIVMPEQQMYMEHDLAQMAGHRDNMPDLKPRDLANPCAGTADYSCAKVGSETVNGRSCDKWRFTAKKKGVSNMTVWIDQKSMVPIRSASDDGSQFDMLNFKEEHQDPSLFEIPAGYQKMGGFGGMMGGRMPTPGKR